MDVRSSKTERFLEIIERQISLILKSDIQFIEY